MLFQKRTSANVPAVRGHNSATVRPNDANDVLPHSAENGASAGTNNSISVKSAKWTVFPDHVTYDYLTTHCTNVQSPNIYDYLTTHCTNVQFPNIFDYLTTHCTNVQSPNIFDYLTTHCTNVQFPNCRAEASPPLSVEFAEFSLY